VVRAYYERAWLELTEKENTAVGSAP